MPSKNPLSSFLLYALTILASYLSSINAETNNTDDDASGYTTMANVNISVNINIDIKLNAFVNCEHVQKLLKKDPSQFDLGQTLDKCWHHGVTLDELNQGVTTVSERSENYNYDDLYLPCADVFTVNITKLTGRLMQDYLDCQNSATLDLKVQSYMKKRFFDIIEVYTMGNLSVEIAAETMANCSMNATKRLMMLCRQYGLTEEQWQRGFLRYHHSDKWVVEEEVSELSVSCDQIFNNKLQEEVYEDPVEVLDKCQKTMGLEPEKKDQFEKMYAERLKEYRGHESLPGVDLRGYVSCRRMRPVQLRNAVSSASWIASDKCKMSGMSYEQLQQGIEEHKAYQADRDIGALYIRCEEVFNEDLLSFTTGLLNDYKMCKSAGKVDRAARRELQRRFAKLFELLTTNKLTKSRGIPEFLVRCTNFTGKLADVCRRYGSTLTQEMRGIGSLARILGDKWLNTENMDKLYVRCDDLFDDYVEYLMSVPVDQYMQCKWMNDLSADGKKFIDKRIAEFYVNNNKWIGTRYIGDADVEISSMILFD